jgi:serine phosphatase RsbU (regulator of sigma subunit)
MKDGDIILTYSDGAVESKNNEGKYYGIEKLGHVFLEAAQTHDSIYDIYESLIEDLKLFKAGTSFFDDTTLLLLRRNEKKDLLTSESVEIQSLKAKE